MDSLIAKIALGLAIPSIIGLIKLYGSVRVNTSEQAEIRKDLDNLASIMRLNGKEISAEIKEFNKQLVDEFKGVRSDFITATRFEDAISKYDVVANDSKIDRAKMWEAIDDIRKTKLSKADHNALCRCIK